MMVSCSRGNSDPKTCNLFSPTTFCSQNGTESKPEEVLKERGKGNKMLQLFINI